MIPWAVFDASVVFRWMAEDPWSAAALSAASTYAPVAPRLLSVEIANALRTQVKAQRYTAEWAVTQIGRVPQLVELRDYDRLLPMALRFGIDRDHGVYGCVYVAMALDRGLPFVTGDNRLARKFAEVPGLEIITLADIAGQ